MQVFNPPLFPRGQIISSLLSDRLTLKFLLALMVVMHETLNKVTDYNPGLILKNKQRLLPVRRSSYNKTVKIKEFYSYRQEVIVWKFWKRWNTLL